jgi:hypothetical protein
MRDRDATRLKPKAKATNTPPEYFPFSRASITLGTNDDLTGVNRDGGIIRRRIGDGAAIVTNCDKAEILDGGNQLSI